jgi:hypothetical protein
MGKILSTARKILFRAGIVSLVINAVLLVYGIASGKSYFAVPRIENSGEEPYLTAACIVALPLPGYDGPALSFGTLSLTLRVGDTAYLQFSTVSQGACRERLYSYRVCLCSGQKRDSFPSYQAFPGGRHPGPRCSFAVFAGRGTLRSGVSRWGAAPAPGSVITS